ncbi:MAG: response regulator transcription factor, partial [Bacteroidales bacterium]|nr:response regulator transcription factor [Bacteroidales bacterium]
MKILIVDDERAIRNSMKEILTDEGYEVDTAEDGAQALEWAD